jgi:hypothetical protein
VTDFSYGLWFGVRYVHLVSVALVAGGAATLCALCAADATAGTAELTLAAAAVYEWAFWGTIGVTVATGVSTLGLKGAGLLGPHTAWGTALTVKLTAVTVLLALSVVRTDFVVRCREWRRPAPPRARIVLGTLYALTVTIVLGALWIGLGLGHGRY